MALKINLLPPESAVTGPLAQIVKITRTLNVIFLGGFIIFAIGLGAFFVFSTLQLQNANTSTAELKTQITALEKSEQQMVLLKDRIGKVQTVLGLTTASKNLKNTDDLLLSVVGSSTLTELDLDSQKSDMSILFRTNSDLSNFLKSLSSVTTFKTAILSSFGYNPANGYLVSVHMI